MMREVGWRIERELWWWGGGVGGIKEKHTGRQEVHSE